VQPAVAYLDIQVSAAVWDPFAERFVGENGDVKNIEDAKQFTLNFGCTGFNVSSQGHIATAGHCVEVTRDDEKALLAMGAEHSAQFYDYTDEKGKVIKDPAAIAKEYDFRFRDEDGRRGTNIDIVAAWDVATGSIESGKGYPARILDFSDFDEGDSALLKADVEDVLAVTIAKGDDIEVGEDVVAVGSPDEVDREGTLRVLRDLGPHLGRHERRTGRQRGRRDRRPQQLLPRGPAGRQRRGALRPGDRGHQGAHGERGCQELARRHEPGVPQRSRCLLRR
jgi:hypothetical protein